jgi:ABC-type amino acid transport substrate-binding protein
MATMKHRILWAGVVIALWAIASSPASAQQTVRVGVATIGAPFSFHDDATNRDQGLMVDLINEIGKTANLKLQLQPTTFASILQALITSKIDVIAATLPVIPQLKMQIGYSQTVYTDFDALIVAKSDSTQYATYDDLKGKVLGLQKGIVPLTNLHTDLYPKIRIYDGGPDVMRALVAGDVDVGVANRSIAGYQLMIGAFPTLQLVPSFKPTTFGDIAFGLRKDDARLTGIVDDALGKVRAAGTLKTILEKWGVQ